MKDEIIQEVWAAKDAIAARCGHDVRVLVEHLREEERKTPDVRVVDLRANTPAEDPPR